jgi:hypothetical protein
MAQYTAETHGMCPPFSVIRLAAYSGCLLRWMPCAFSGPCNRRNLPLFTGGRAAWPPGERPRMWAGRGRGERQD